MLTVQVENDCLPCGIELVQLVWLSVRFLGNIRAKSDMITLHDLMLCVRVFQHKIS